MRLNRLELLRYGRFQDAALDFGDGAPEGPDVSVVYGANEAGKSTAFTAWLDLLFGFRGATHYAFRFDRKDLLVGAVVETPEGPRTLRRSTANTGSLTDANGYALAEERLSGWLFGLDREAYRTRFSLNDAVLRQGGEQIAKAQGDLGQLLHAGSSGLAGLTDALAKIEAEVEGFHKKGGRTTAANEGRKRLRDLDAELRAARLDPRGFDRLTGARDDAEAAFATARDALVAAKLGLRLHDAAGARRAIGRDIEAAREELARYPEGPDLPAGAVARVIAAAERRAGADEAAAKARAAEAAAGAALAGLDGDPAGQEVAALLAELDAAVFEDGEPLLPRVQTAHADLPRRHRDLGEILVRMTALAEPGRDPATMVLPRSRLAELRGAADAVRTARAKLDGERKVRLEAEAALGAAVEQPPGSEALEQALTAWHRLPETLDQALGAARQAEAALAEGAAGLPPDWRATAEAGLPEVAEIDAVAEAARRARSRRDAAAGPRTTARQEWRRSVETLEAARARPDVVLDGHIAESRARRERAWDAHLRGLDRATADEFATAMRDDDAAREGHAASAEHRARLAQVAEETARLRATLDAREGDVAAAEAGVATTDAAVDAMAARLGLPAAAPVEALRPRRDRLESAQVLARRAEAGAAAARVALETRTARLDALRAALGADGDLAPDRLPALAEERVRELRASRASFDGWREARASVERMERSEMLAADALARLGDALATRLRGLWCADLDADQLLAALPALEDLAALDEERGRLAARIDAMEEAVAAFAPRAERLGALLGLGDAPPPDLLAAARRRAAEAGEAARRLRAETEARAKAESALRDAMIERAARDGEIAELLAGQAAGAETDPAERVDLLSRRDAARRGLAEAEAARAAAGRDLDPAALALAEADADPARGEVLREQMREAEEERDAALEERSRARMALETAMTGEGGATLDQERAALVESLRQGAREALARQFGLMAARSALRRFRQSHRGAMLETTEAAFAHITGGEWPRLDTLREGANERLVGVRDDAPVAVGAMSTGTQGQLYLALRIAGHAAFVAEHGPLPFVTDDIHETFDDARARAALELSARMGERGQTILFTHHRHLVDLARETIPTVRVLELPAR